MFAVQGIYNNGIVTIEDPVPINNRYNVVVTFIRGEGFNTPLLAAVEQ